MSIEAPGWAAKGNRAARSQGLMLLGGAVALLLLGVIAFDRARVLRVQAQREVANVELRLAEARGREQLAQRNRALLSVANEAQQRAQVSRVLPAYWNERQISLRQQILPRDQLNAVLLSTARTSNQLLKLEDFDVAVTHPDEGLFDLLGGARLPVMVSLRGALNFRISD